VRSTYSDWRKSSYSGSQPNCVEISASSAAIRVRDSKHRRGPTLGFARADWTQFAEAVSQGRFDR
jgi:hypothetical protein